jgi:hypothetical protein
MQSLREMNVGEARRKAEKHRHLFIAVPLRDRNLDVFTVGSILNAQKDFAARGWSITIDFSMGTHAIHHARNMLCRKFMSMPECTDILFLDADVGAPMGSIMRLMDHPVDFVTALYRLKFEPACYPVTAPDGGSNFDVDEATGLLKVGGAGVGFTRCSRRVLQTMLDDLKLNNPESWYFDRNPDDRLWPFFSFGQDGHASIGEDVFFYKRWQMLGGTCYADAHIQTFHVGPQVFTGVFADGCTILESKAKTETIDLAEVRKPALVV